MNNSQEADWDESSSSSEKAFKDVDDTASRRSNEDEIDAELHNPLHKTVTQKLTHLLSMDTMPKLESKLTSDEIIEEGNSESDTSQYPKHYPLGSPEPRGTQAKDHGQSEYLSPVPNLAKHNTDFNKASAKAVRLLQSEIKAQRQTSNRTMKTEGRKTLITVEDTEDKHIDVIDTPVIDKSAKISPTRLNQGKTVVQEKVSLSSRQDVIDTEPSKQENERWNNEPKKVSTIDRMMEQIEANSFQNSARSRKEAIDD